MSSFDINKIRAQFPALTRSKTCYMDNAGGSQVLATVAESISDYLLTNNVQLGASYDISQKSTNTFNAGFEAVAKYINATSDSVVLGPSTTQLFRNLSLALYDHLTPGSEIIISQLDHEANISSWVQLAAWRQCTVKWWTCPPNTTNPHLSLSTLATLLTPRTRLVACTHTSNILGTISPIAAIAAAVHQIPGALLAVDGVAYAPHAPVDVAAWDVDVYAFSWYKVYGPHVACLYASARARAALSPSLGHFFHAPDALGTVLGLAGASYELVAGVPAVTRYLAGGSVTWEEVAAHEERLQGVLIAYLLSKPEVFTIYGEPTADRTKRMPVISFTVKGRRSKDVVDAIEARSDYACRWGSFYSNRLAEKVLGLDPVDGVVRVSLVHYNSVEEVEGYVKVLDEVIQG